MKELIKKIKILTIAKTLANEFDYCPEFKECSNDYKDYLSFEASEDEVKKACEENQGRRSDEITNDYDRLFI